MYLEHSHQLLYKCVKYIFWPFLHILNQKTHYISPFKIVYNHLKFSTSYDTRVNLHGHCSMCIQFFINFRSHQFFSLLSVHNDLNSSSSFSQMHTNTSSQKNQHRDILAKKKKGIHKHTHTQTNPNGKTKKRQIGAYPNNRSSWVSLDQSSWVWVLPDWSQGDRCLWIGAREN